MNTMPPVERAVSRPGTSGALAWTRRRKTEFPPSADLAALTRRHIQERLIRQVEAMTLYALGAGIGVPPDVVATLDRALSDMPDDKAADRAEAVPRAAAINAEPPGWGITPTAGDAAPGVGPAAAPTTASAEMQDQMSLLANAHLELTKLIAPARPASLVLLIDERRNSPFWQSFGAVPMVRKMLALAVLSLLVMLGIALSNEVNADNMAKGLLALQGTKLLVNEIFLVAAAGVGATLANLKRLDRYVSNCTYDQRYESSYWTRLVMGLISGVVLSQVVYGVFASPSTAAAASSTTNPFSAIGQPILALLGGFSAELVHDILTHFISVIRNAFGGNRSPSPAEDLTAAAESKRA